MTFVVDASVAVKWFVQESERELARRLLAGGEPLCAPDLLFAEVANVLWRKARRGEIAARQCDRAVELIGSAFGEVVSSRLLAADALKLARELDHPVYDCVYLACAASRDAMLVTADQRLAGRAAGLPGVKVTTLHNLIV